MKLSTIALLAAGGLFLLTRQPASSAPKMPVVRAATLADMAAWWVYPNDGSVKAPKGALILTPVGPDTAPAVPVGIASTWLAAQLAAGRRVFLSPVVGKTLDGSSVRAVMTSAPDPLTSAGWVEVVA